MASTADDSTDGPPRALLIAAIAIAVGAIVAVLAVAVLRQAPAQEDPVPIATVPAPQADSPECTALMAALPEQLGDYRRAPAADPAPAGAAAWRAESVTEPVILRCGLDRPLDFVAGAPTQVVEPVAVVRADRRGQEHLVRGGPPRIYSPDPAERIGPDAHPGDLADDREDDARQGGRSGARPLAQAGPPRQRGVHHRRQQGRIVDAAGRPHPRDTSRSW